jgi:hypothetical protein
MLRVHAGLGQQLAQGGHRGEGTALDGTDRQRQPLGQLDCVYPAK